MATMLLAWAVFPLLLTAGCLGIGLLADSAARRGGGRGIAAVLLVPLGFAAVAVLTSLLTAVPAVARYTPAVVLLLGAGGLASGLRARLPWRLPRAGWAAVAVYLVYAAPALAVGKPTFAGWIKLDDGASFLALAEQSLTVGASAPAAPSSTYQTLMWVFSDGAPYPRGALLAPGIGQRVLGVDASLLFQPYMAWLGGVLALALAGLLARHIQNRTLRAAAVFIAAQPGLLYGYSLWGGVKEMALAPLLVLLAVLAVRLDPVPLVGLRGAGRLAGALLPLAVAAAAVLVVTGVSGAAWLAIPAIWVSVAWLRALGWAQTAGAALLAVAAIAVLSAPVLLGLTWQDLKSMLGYSAVGPDGGADIGNLWGRVPVAQVTGIWPVGDFRATPTHMTATWALIGMAVAAAILGLWTAWRGRCWELWAYALTCLPLALLMGSVGGVWVGAKALAVSSPVVLSAAMVGCAWLISNERLAGIGGFAMAGVAIGVLAGSWLGYRQVWLAPPDQIAELAEIGADESLPSPGLMLDYNPYGARFYLRELQVQGAGELRRDAIARRDGTGLTKAAYADIDEYPQASLAQFQTLVLRRSARASRPPADWRLDRAGDYYEVWVRDPEMAVVSHLNLGSADQAAQIPICSAVTALAGMAPPGSQLAYVVRPAVITATPTQVPPGWQVSPSGEIWANSDGQMVLSLSVPQAGRYTGWIAGSFRGDLELSVGSQVIFSQRHILNWSGHGSPTEAVDLPKGEVEVLLTYSLPKLAPGVDGREFAFGPIRFATTTAATDYQLLDPKKAKQICGKELDWVALVQPRTAVASGR